MSDEKYVPKVGDRVEVTTQGVVKEVSAMTSGATHIRVNGAWWWLEDERVTVKHLPDPEPVWKKGDVVRDANGVVWVRGEGKWEFGCEVYLHSVPTRPLVRLTPEEKV